LLEKNPQDQAAWLLKCKALTKKSYVDDLEIEEEGVGDMLMGKQTYSNYFFR
jgi:tetratricopeptide repeat protein 8